MQTHVKFHGGKIFQKASSPPILKVQKLESNSWLQIYLIPQNLMSSERREQRQKELTPDVWSANGLLLDVF